MQCEIIVIGDELLIGQVIDTNSGMLARYLNTAGISVGRTTAVHDSADDISNALNEAFSRVNLVLMTGGLGPTKDDITKTTLCKYFNTRLVENLEVKEHVMSLYKDRPAVLNSLTATQWLVPEACNVLENRVGSAPLMEFLHDGKRLYCMPGVPHEAQVAMEEQIMPRLRELACDNVIVHRTVIVYDIPESSLALRIAEWEGNLPSYMHLAYLPSNRMIRLRLTAEKRSVASELAAEADKQIAELLPLIKEYVIATEDKPIEVLVGEALKQRHETVSTAESCTGGKIAELLNRHAGSSEFYFGTIVAYDNSIKEYVLGVNRKTLDTVGAVSQETVTAMVCGVRRLMNTSWAIATSGVAGPSGGSPDKPVGTVWLAVACEGDVWTEKRCFRGSREQITTQATIAALVMLHKKMTSEYNH